MARSGSVAGHGCALTSLCSLAPTLRPILTPMPYFMLAGTICACTISWFYMPVVGRERRVIRSLLQDFCWSQKGEAAEIAARDEIIRRLELYEGNTSAKSPMFCVETCLLHLYASNYVYACSEHGGGADVESCRVKQAPCAEEPKDSEDPKDPEDPNDSEDPKNSEDPAQPTSSSIPGPDMSKAPFSSRDDLPGSGNIDDALFLWGAEGCEIIVEPKTDTVALALWSSKRLVLAFKGTSSAENVRTDLDVIKTVHEPKRKVQVSKGITKKISVPRTPMVHRGFWKSWKKKGFDERIKRLVKRYIDTYHADSDDPVELHVTGHSLGGALATLAAFDLTQQFRVDTTVYTFGQPRVGNRAFATEYNATVIKHFSVANGHDPVARVPKGSYTKNGIRVVTSKTGDVVVAPSSLESHVLNNSTPETKDHLLESYRRAWMVSIKQQFGPKAVPSLTQNGRIGAISLASEVALNLALMGSNMDIESLESFDVHPVTEEDIAKLREREEKMRRIVEGDVQGTGCAPSLSTNTLAGCCGKPDTHE